MKSKTVLFYFVLGLCLAVAAAGCGSGGKVLVDRQVTVPGGGGTAEVTFKGKDGQTIQISLQAADSSMDPFGYLENPDESGEYTPMGGLSLNGQNSSKVTLDQTGTYRLSIMDGTNLGGAVAVKVEVIE